MQAARQLAQRQLLTQGRRNMSLHYSPAYNPQTNYVTLDTAYITHPALMLGIPIATGTYVYMYNTKDDVSHPMDRVLSATTFKEGL